MPTSRTACLRYASLSGRNTAPAKSKCVLADLIPAGSAPARPAGPACRTCRTAAGGTMDPFKDLRSQLEQIIGRAWAAIALFCDGGLRIRFRARELLHPGFHLRESV